MKHPSYVRNPGVAILALAIGLGGAACSSSPEAKSARYLDAGKKLLKRNDSARAILQFQNAVRATPKNPEVYFQLALAYYASGDVPKTVASLRKTLELNPKHAGAQLRLAQLMSGTNDTGLLNDAEQRLKNLVLDSPDNAEALHALGLTEMKLGDSKDAMQHLEQAMAAAPKELLFAISLAVAKLQNKDFQGAEDILKKACEKSPNSADAADVLGRFYASQKKTAESEQQFQRALALNPRDAQAWLDLGTLEYSLGRKQDAERDFKRLYALPDKMFKPVYPTFLLQEGRRDEALKEFEKLAQQDPDDRTARTRLISAYEATGRAADAQKVLSAALKKNPKDTEALLQRSEFSLAAGKYPEAETDLNQVLRLKPDSAEAHYTMAQLRRARGETLQYRQELNETLRLNPSLLLARLELAKSLTDNSAQAALDVLDEAPEDQKNTLAIVEQRNWIFIKTHEIAKARAGVQEGLANARTPDLLLQDAVLKALDKRYNEARQSLHEVMAKAPEDIRALQFLTNSYALQKQTPAAVAEVRAQAAKYPKSAAIQYYLGALLLETGNKPQAKEAFLSAKALDPNYTAADLSLAQIDLTGANWNSARQELNGILSSKNADPTARLWLGMLEESVGNHTAAIEAFRKVVDIQPNNSTALNNLAYLLAENAGRPDEALKYAEKAKELNPEDARVDDTLGWVLYRKGLYPEAVKYLEAANAKQASAGRKIHLAMAYMKSGEKERARTTLNAALRLNPKLEEAKAAQELIK